MNCDKCKDLITPLIHGLLKPDAKQSVVEHIKGCPGCLAEFKQTKALHDRLTGNGHALARKNLEPAVWERITREKAAQLEAGGEGVSPLNRGQACPERSEWDAHHTTEAARQATKSLIVRRNLMRSPLSKLAAAAVIVIAGIMGIVMWTGTGSGIVLADVLMQVQQATAYMYQMTGTITGKVPTGQDLNQNMQTTVLVSQDYGMKMTMSMPDPNGGTIQSSEIYMLPQEKVMISLMPATKQYRRMELDDSMVETTRRQNYDPGAMLQQVLNSKYESLGRSRIDGVDVEGFRTTDPNFLAGMGAGVDVRIWVDVKTQYPVRLDMDMRMMEMEIHAVIHEFQWDYPVDAATFTPVIPADYTALPGMKMPAMDEHSAIAGLKLCAELTGQYPEKLDFMTAASMMSK
ncbi:MAG TPA: hypothetical protein ENN81_02525, partial [Phycisphaerales bacterium]|nr:hypothetical protein [Phycisphaerales bacterium]